jgi:DMSO reductase family type II enzyme heme b subunit
MAAPPGLSPGGYVRAAYADRTRPATPWVDLAVDARGDGWRVLLSWPCPQPVERTQDDVDRFADAAAVLAPLAPDAPMMTMGTATAGVDGWLWRADRERGLRIAAHGLGSVERSAVPKAVSIAGVWTGGRWGVSFELPAWDALTRERRIAVAVWRGVDAERAGLKSVSPDWIALP